MEEHESTGNALAAALRWSRRYAFSEAFVIVDASHGSRFDESIRSSALRSDYPRRLRDDEARNRLPGETRKWKVSRCFMYYLNCCMDKSWRTLLQS